MTSQILPLVLPLLLIAGTLVVITCELRRLSLRAQRTFAEAETFLARLNHMTEQTEVFFQRGFDLLRHWRRRWNGHTAHRSNGTSRHRRAAGKSP